MQEREHSAVSGPTLQEHKSLAFRQLLAELSGGEKKRVLDLGRAIGGNVSFFSQFSCKLFIADIHQSLPNLADGKAPLAEALAEVLPGEEAAPVDLILAWDLFNYLELPQIEVLTEALAPISGKKTLLFSMISTLKEIPHKPLDYEVRDSQTLAYSADLRLKIPCPRYKEPILERTMPSFSVETSFLLRNGIQEYLFAFTPPQSTTESAAASTPS